MMPPPPSLETPSNQTAEPVRRGSASALGDPGRKRTMSDAGRRLSASLRRLSSSSGIESDEIPPAMQSRPSAQDAPVVAAESRPPSTSHATSVDGNASPPRLRASSDARNNKPKFLRTLSSSFEKLSGVQKGPAVADPTSPRASSAPPTAPDAKKKRVGLFGKRKDSITSSKLLNDGPLKQDAQQAALVKEAMANKKLSKSPRGARRETNLPAKRTCADWSERFPTLSRAQIEREMQATPDEAKLEARLREHHLRILDTPPLSKTPPPVPVKPGRKGTSSALSTARGSSPKSTSAQLAELDGFLERQLDNDSGVQAPDDGGDVADNGEGAAETDEMVVNALLELDDIMRETHEISARLSNVCEDDVEVVVALDESEAPTAGGGGGGASATGDDDDDDEDNDNVDDDDDDGTEVAAPPALGSPMRPPPSLQTPEEPDVLVSVLSPRVNEDGAVAVVPPLATKSVLPRSTAVPPPPTVAVSPRGSGIALAAIPSGTQAVGGPLKAPPSLRTPDQAPVVSPRASAERAAKAVSPRPTDGPVGVAKAPPPIKTKTPLVPPLKRMGSAGAAPGRVSGGGGGPVSPRPASGQPPAAPLVSDPSPRGPVKANGVSPRGVGPPPLKKASTTGPAVPVSAPVASKGAIARASLMVPAHAAAAVVPHPNQRVALLDQMLQQGIINEAEHRARLEKIDAGEAARRYPRPLLVSPRTPAVDEEAGPPVPQFPGLEAFELDPVELERPYVKPVTVSPRGSSGGGGPAAIVPAGRGRGGLKHVSSVGGGHVQGARPPVVPPSQPQQHQQQTQSTAQRSTPSNPTHVLLGPIPTIKKAPAKVAVVPPLSVAAAPVKQLFCHACGTKVPDGANARFCLSCGTKLLN